jgi:hypothetical protein
MNTNTDKNKFLQKTLLLLNIAVFFLCIIIVVKITPVEEKKEKLSYNNIPTKCYIIDAQITGYSSTVCQTDNTPFVPAFAKKVFPGGCAVSKPLLQLAPPGSKIVIDGKIYTVNDLMNPEKEKSGMILAVDIWCSTIKQAKKVGKSWKTIVVIPNLKNKKE